MLKRTDPYLLTLIALLIGLILFKVPTLGLAYFWDEAWVYAPAVKAMYEHGPSLSPSALPPELSRGHPVLFHAMAAAWMTMLGTSRTSLHAFALAISLIVLLLTYSLAARNSSKVLGISAVLLVLLNETFLAQSTILLPEMTMTLFLLVGLWAYLERRTMVFVIALWAALMTKESALILVIALFLWQLHRTGVPQTSEARRKELQWTFILLVPLGLSTVYFFVQWLQRGWFFYPEHLGMITWGSTDIVYKAKLIYQQVFEQQGSLIMTYAACIAAPLLWNFLPLWRRALAILLCVAAIKILWGRWPAPFLPALAAVLLCFAGLYPTLLRPLAERKGRTGELIGIIMLFTIGYWSFSALNFFSDRYLLCLVPFLAIGLCSAIALATEDRPKWIFAAVMLVVAVGRLLTIGTDPKIGDTRLNYADAIHVQTELVAYCESHALQREQFHGNFMDRHYMTDTTLGYLSGNDPFWLVADTLAPRTSFAIIGNATEPATVLMLEQNGFAVERRFEQGKAWTSLLHREPLP
jgi:4-amino-4-deoxy-L-arabinose transferase-like glycosyltransferase